MAAMHDLIDLTAIREDSDLWVRSKKEIVGILLNVMRKHALVSIYFAEGREFVLTSILDVDTVTGAVVFEYGADESANQRVLQSEKIIFVTRDEGVKIQFMATKLEKAAFDGARAFRIKVPEALLRVQRREHYRLKTPIVNPIKCQVPVPEELGYSKAQLQLTLHDISVGGVSLVGYPLDLKLVPNMVFPECRLDIPVVGSIWATLMVSNVLDVTLKNGARSKRVGCRFVDLASGDQAKIQRYIINVERERNAKLAGVSFGL
jgi:c-di-GMP-binding flagellar brake protein YcgR